MNACGYTLEQALAELQETRRLVATMTAELKTARSAVTQLSRCLDRAEVREQNLRERLEATLRLRAEYAELQAYIQATVDNNARIS